MLASTMPLGGMSKKSGGPKPAAIVPAAANEFAALNWFVCLTGKL